MITFALSSIYVIGAVLFAGAAYGASGESCSPWWIAVGGLTWPLWLALIIVGCFLSSKDG